MFFAIFEIFEKVKNQTFVNIAWTNGPKLKEIFTKIYVRPSEV